MDLLHSSHLRCSDRSQSGSVQKAKNSPLKPQQEGELFPRHLQHLKPSSWTNQGRLLWRPRQKSQGRSAAWWAGNQQGGATLQVRVVPKNDQRERALWAAFRTWSARRPSALASDGAVAGPTEDQSATEVNCGNGRMRLTVLGPETARDFGITPRDEARAGKAQLSIGRADTKRPPIIISGLHQNPSEVNSATFESKESHRCQTQTDQQNAGVGIGHLEKATNMPTLQ